jgi:hypothetical protein
MMDLNLATSLVTHLLAFTLGLQALEIFILSLNPLFFKVWNFDSVFSNKALQAVVILQMASALAGFFYPAPTFFAVLFLTNLLICMRFRGTFNGGSDMMAFVVLTGVLITLCSTSEKGQQLGLIYIAIHTLYSYFKAGIVKLIQHDWRSGKALPAFLNRSLFSDVKSISHWLGLKPTLSLFACWIVLVFELAAFGLVFFPGLAIYYFMAALFFHLMNFLSFGLNRFFWMWLTAWPALLYSLFLIQN